MLDSKREKFLALKEKFQKSSARESWVFEKEELLIPQGGLVEVVGGARFEWMVEFLSEQPELTVAWVESEWTLFPPAVLQRGVDVTRWLLLEAGEKALWAVEELLTSHFFSVILAPELKVSLPVWRRLQLECERAGSTLFILSEEEHKQVNSLFIIQTEWSQGGLKSEWKRCRQELKKTGG